MWRIVASSCMIRVSPSGDGVMPVGCAFSNERPLGPAVDCYGVSTQEADVAFVQNALDQPDALVQLFEYDREIVVLGVVHAAVVWEAAMPERRPTPWSAFGNSRSPHLKMSQR